MLGLSDSLNLKILTGVHRVTDYAVGNNKKKMIKFI